MREHSSKQVAGLLTALVLLGTRSSYAQPFDIVTLLSPNEQRKGQFGRSVSEAGDVNRDGHADVIVGAPLDGAGSGGAYVFSGQDASLLLELGPPNSGAVGGFGYSVAAAGDTNQDGFADLIVGATANAAGVSPNDAGQTDAFSGRAYILSGKDGGLLFAFEPPGMEARSGPSGSSVAAAGDVNQDGAPDVIVGTGWANSFTDPKHCGRAYVFSGKDGSLIFELIPPHKEEDGRFGDSVGGVGDADHDGFADVIVGAWGEDPDTSPEHAGRAYVFSGQDGSLLFELTSPNEEVSGAFGWSVAGAGDVNQDGTPDALVGAHGEDPGTSPNDAGRAYAFSGRDGSLLLALASPNEEASGNFGRSVAGAGEANGDGHADVIVGAPQEDPGTSPGNAGRAYVFSGQDGSLLFALGSPNEAAGGNFGHSISGAGDLDQDGFADLIVGAYGENGQSGRAYLLVSGSPQALKDQLSRAPAPAARR